VHEPGDMEAPLLKQIPPANVSRLTKAWTYDTGAPAAGYTITPIVVNNVMYFPIQGSTIVALKADAGTELWQFDLKSIPGSATNPSAGVRGISYWPGVEQKLASRIVIATTNGFLVQLDAKTGVPIEGE